MYVAATQPIERLLSAYVTELGQSGDDAADRRPVFVDTVLRVTADDMAFAASRCLVPCFDGFD